MFTITAANVVNRAGCVKPFLQIIPGADFGGGVAGSYMYLADAANGFSIYSLEPRLDIRVATTNTAAPTWFTLNSPDNYVLQQNADLTPSKWEMVINTPSIGRGKRQVVVQSAKDSASYQLKYP